MTAQDWWPGLADEDDQQPAAPPHRRRLALAGAGALTVLLVLAALVVVLVSHVGPHRPGTSVAAAAAPSSPSPVSSPAQAPQQGPVVIEAALLGPRVTGGPTPLIVGMQPLQGGVAPDRVPNFDTCHADAATLQYLPIQIRNPVADPSLWLTATVTVQTTASTPAGIGRLGFFFQAGEASTPCPNGAWSTSDSFQVSNYGQEVITGYIVLDKAFTPSTPQGRADVFRTLQLRVSDIRSGTMPLIVSPPTVGSLCPGTQNELCAALG